MAKPKLPLLSLGAHGTIGDALTYQKRGRDTIVRQKPTPRDPYSLKQAYQRWDYRDYAYQWTLLTDSEKQLYRTRASKYHITGFSQFMREQLKTLPDLAGRWHLDNIIAGKVLDSSKNANHGTIFGASPATGLIAGAFSFDGSDDYIHCGLCSNLNIQVFTFSAFIFPLSITDNSSIIGQYSWAIGQGGWSLNKMLNRIGLFIFTDASQTIAYSPTIPTANHWYFVHATYDKVNITVYLDLVPGTPVPHTQDLKPSANPLIIGGRSDSPTSYSFDGIIDNSTLHSRIIDLTEAKRHSERRYP